MAHQIIIESIGDKYNCKLNICIKRRVSHFYEYDYINCNFSVSDLDEVKFRMSELLSLYIRNDEKETLS